MAIILLLSCTLAPAVVVGMDIATPVPLTRDGNSLCLVDFRGSPGLLLGSVPGVLVVSRVAPIIPGNPPARYPGVLIFVGARLL